MKVRILSALAAATIVAGLAMSGAATASAPSAAKSSSGKPDPAATLTLASSTLPTQWDPHAATSDAVGYQYLSPVYDQLLVFDNKLNIKPSLAESYTLSPDNKTLTLKLRKDVTFQDGSPFNAAAVVANFDYTKAKNNALTATLIAAASGWTATDASTVTVNFTTSGADWPLNLAFKIALGGMVSPAALANPATLATTPAGSGPYKLTAQAQDRATYEKVTNYWNKDALAKLPKTLIGVGIADDNARIAALQAGQLDLTVLTGPVPNQSSIVDGKTIKSWQAAVSNRMIFSLLNFVKQPLFNNPDVRRALSMAINRAALATTITSGACVATGGPLVPGNAGNDPKATDKTGAYKYDPKAAKALLEKAGATGLAVKATVVQTPIFLQLATAVQAQFKEIGVDFTYDVTPSTQSQPTWRTGNYDMSIASSNASPDPNFVIGSYYVKNPVFQPFGEDATLTSMNAAAAVLPYGSKERDKAYQEISAYINKTPTLIQYCTWPPAAFYNAKVGGTTDSGWAQITSVWDSRSFYVIKGKS